MRGGRFVSQALARAVATPARASGQAPMAASSSTSSWSLAGSSSSSSSSYMLTSASNSGAMSAIRHRALLSTSSKAMRPAKTQVAQAELVAARASLGQVPSMDIERGAFADMMLRESQPPKRLGHMPKVKIPLTRKERRAREKAGRKKQKELAKSQSMFGKAGLERTEVTPFVREDGQFRTFKPITPSLRWVRQTVQPHLYKGPPLRSLTLPKRKHGGRNHHGKITVRGRGGGNRLRLRIVDFARLQTGLQTVQRIERDPNRSAHIALVEHNETKQQSYIIAPEGVRAGDTVESYRRSAIATGKFEGSALDLGIFRTKAIRPGNVLPLRLIPIGTEIHAVSLLPHGTAKLVRSAGSYGQIVAFVNRNKTMKPESVGPEGASSADASTSAALPGSVPEAAPAPDVAEATDADAGGKGGMPTTTHVQVRLQSGEVRLLPIDCCAAIGRVSNGDHEHVRLGKAGRSRWRGRRPKVRGVAMNAVDHPHGGGRGKSKSNKLTRSIYGWKTKGLRTRKPGTRNGNQMVVRERPRMNGKRATKA